MMKRNLTILSVFFVVSFALGQQTPAVEEIYEKHITATGRDENIINQKTVTLTSSSMEYTSTIITGQSTTQQSMTIDFVDYINHQMVAITKDYPSTSNGNKATFTKSISVNGKTTTLLPDGRKMENQNGIEQFEESSLETIIPSGSKVLPNEIFNGKEVFVINYGRILAGAKYDCYEYFEIASGLKIGFKQISKNEISGASSTSNTMIVNYEYKEMNGSLLSYKTRTNSIIEITTSTVEPSISDMAAPFLSQLGVDIDTNEIDERFKQKNTKNQTTIIKSESETEILAVEINTDIEDFKQNCFQNPEECFAKYEKN